MAGHFLHHSPLECSELDLKYKTLVLSIFTWIYGCTSAWCPAEGITKVCFEKAEKGFPQTNYQQVLN